MLAALLIERGRAVSARALADRVWDDDPPDGFRGTLQSYISRLRRRLRNAGESGELIASGPAGYRMNVSLDRVDVHCFDRLVSQAQARAEADPSAARRLFRQAEALWIGEPLAGLTGSWATAVQRILTDKRRAAILRRIELDLRSGASPAEAVVELSELAATNRTDERVAGLLMTTLGRDGRTTDALRVYRDFRDQLHKLTGTEPGPELRMVHQRLLNGSAKTQPAVDRRQTPDEINTLDTDPTFIAGRDADISALIETVDADLLSGARRVTYSVDGLGGIGKSALALRAAHLLRKRCPDGALQINLRTHDEHLPPLDPREALTQLLDAVGTPFRELGRADTLASLAALWRRRTSGKRLLLVLDDVQDFAQIEPLLPATPGTIVLITSRRRLVGPPDLRHLTVAPLSDAAAIALLAHITERDLSGDGDLDRFTRCFGGLALAITLAAGHLRGRAVWTVGDLVDRFSMMSRALADDPLTGPIHTAFAMSYRALDGTLRDLLRYVAAHPGADIGLPAAAAMSQGALADTDARLDALVDHRLLDHAGPHRYRLHDLLRQYILAQSVEQHQIPDNQHGVERAIAFYRAAAARADHAQNPRRWALHYPAASTTQDGVFLDTPEQARAWLDQEHLNLAALTAWTVQQGHGTLTGLLPHVLIEHLDHRGRSHEALEYIEQTLAAHLSSGTESGAVAARLLTDQAAVYIRTDDLGKALESAQAALTVWTADDDRYGQADAHFQIGRVHYVAGRHDEAVAAYRAAAALYGALGDNNRVAAAENLCAVATFFQGHHEQAFALSNHALDLARRENDLRAICDALINLGELHRTVGHQTRALAYFHEARVLSESLGDPLVTAVLGNNFGAIYEHAGNFRQALASFEQALHAFRAIGDHRSEIDSLILMATAHTRLNDHTTALAELREAAALAEHARDQRQQAQIQLAEGHVYRASGDTLRAIDAYRNALALAEQAAALMEQSEAHRALSEVFATTGDDALSREHQQAALATEEQLS
ncbi:tetratricopeptide repeat protein [Catenulispora sp. NL8]|uniref:Tetratricopeptide repeat protein n=1 Tax=Catenulispora pinistramenti TaxID=2705254 RepID=A0ABS5KH70_9ACTN|nr:tetratricopeptide repeat protein [Catenulispora pinistramenti]